MSVKTSEFVTGHENVNCLTTRKKKKRAHCDDTEPNQKANYVWTGTSRSSSGRRERKQEEKAQKEKADRLNICITGGHHCTVWYTKNYQLLDQPTNPICFPMQKAWAFCNTLLHSVFTTTRAKIPPNPLLHPRWLSLMDGKEGSRIYVGLPVLNVSWLSLWMDLLHSAVNK